MLQKLKLDEYMLYTHGPDLCSEGVMEHAMANCLEALMGKNFYYSGSSLSGQLYVAATE